MNKEKKEILTYDELRRIQQNERDNKLQKLDKNFMEKLREYINEKRNLIAEKENEDNIFSKEMKMKLKNELDNTFKIIEEIYGRRERKIVNEALLSARIPDRVPDYSKMLDFEEKIFNEILEILKKYRKEILEKTLKEESIEKESKIEKTEIKEEKKEEIKAPIEPISKKIEEKINEKNKLIKITSFIPSFIWTDGKTYGPFKEEDIINIDQEIANILINSGKAIEIKVEK
jgi:DNA replication initiation complex subunit (GINS family)